MWSACLLNELGHLSGASCFIMRPIVPTVRRGDATSKHTLSTHLLNYGQINPPFFAFIGQMGESVPQEAVP